MQSLNFKENHLEEYETTRSLDCFGGELQNLKKMIYSRSLMNLKLYEFVLSKYLSHFHNAQCIVFALCLMYVAIEALDQAKKSNKNSEEGKWKQELKYIKQIIEEVVTNNQIGERRMKFYSTLKENTNISRLKHEYQHFFEIQALFIYKKSKNIWRLFQFQLYCSQSIQQSILNQQQVNIEMEKFNIQLIKKQNQFGLNEHIEQCMLQLDKEQCHDYKSMMNIQTFLPIDNHKHRKLSTIKYSQPRLQAGFTVKQLMIMEINMETISLVERCETYECPYMLFEVPFVYLLAETLSYYQSNFKQMYLYHIFTTLCRKINKIKNSSNPQLPKDDINDYLVDFLNFQKSTGRQHAKKLGQFISKNEIKMSTFIPVYYQIFSFHAFQKYNFVDKLFTEKLSISEKRKKMKERIQRIYDSCQKYNNEDI